MSLAIRAFFIALFAVMKRWKIVLFFYLLNLLFSLFLAAPLFREISNQGGHLGGMEAFLAEFDPESFIDFSSHNEGILKSFSLTVAFGGAIYFFIFHLFSGGMIAILADPRERTSMKTFLKTCGKFSFRFTRLFFYFILLLACIALINLLLDRCLNWYITEVREYGVGSKTMGWLFLVKNVMMIFLLGYTIASLNYAKTKAVVEDRHFMGGSLIGGMGFTLAHPIVTGLFFLFAAALPALLMYAYFTLSRWIDPKDSYYILDSIGGITLSGALLYFLLAQGVQLFIQGCFIFRHAGQIYIYKYLTVRATHLDPELASPDPFSPFIPDRPLPEIEPKEGQTAMEGHHHG